MRRFVPLFLLLFFLMTSCEEIVNEEDITNDTILILAPTKDAVLTSGDISFNWELLNGADSYQLQIATPNFTIASQIALDTVIGKTNFTKALEVGSYEWRVKGMNSAFETVYTVNAFTVEEP